MEPFSAYSFSTAMLQVLSRFPKDVPSARKFGLRYFADEQHYRQSDLEEYLPQWKQLEVGWLVLPANPYRAIPESFLKGVLQAGIEPIVHVVSTPIAHIPPQITESLLSAYARWGVKHVVYFDRPNERTQWGNSRFSGALLPSQFLSLWLPLAELTLDYGMPAILPPLQQGGNYWDTLFLENVLQEIRDNHPHLLDRLMLGAYGYQLVADSAHWGKGGPQVWSKSRPYITPPDSQDQRGFYAFEWYDACARKVLGASLPQLLLAGAPSPASFRPQKNLPGAQPTLHYAKSALASTDLPEYLRNIAVPL